MRNERVAVMSRAIYFEQLNQAEVERRNWNVDKMRDETIQLEQVRCGLCGQDDAAIVLTTKDWLHNQPGEFHFVRCNKCGLVYLNPRPVRESILNYYPSDYAYAPTPVSDASTQPETRRSKLLQTILARYYSYPPRHTDSSATSRLFSSLYHTFYKMIALPIVKWRPAGRMLDVGCGKGDYLAAQRRLGWQVHGIEINPHAVQYARDVLKLDVFEGDIAQSNFPPDHFDVITMWWYLEHVHDPLHVLRQARQIIRRDGTLIVGVPNWNSLEARWFGRAWYHLDAPRHLYLFTPDVLDSMLRQAGFQTIALDFILWLDDPAQTIERWLKIRTGRERQLPKPLRLALAPLSWLAARVHRSSLIIATAQVRDLR